METKRLTTLGYIILGLLHREKLTGYGVRKVFETTPMRRHSSSPGTIYPALRRLQKFGLIEQVLVEKENQKPKKYFHLTPEGERRLGAWLHLPIEEEDIEKRLPELFLRFVFMENVVSLKKRIQFLESFKKEIERYVLRLEQFRDATRNKMSLHGSLALEHGIEGHKVQARWAAHAIETLKKDNLY